MHVLFDARLLHRPLSGLERVQRNLLRELAERPAIHRLRAVVLAGTRLAPELRRAVEVLEVHSSEDILRILTAAEQGERPDLYHLSWFPDRYPRDLWLPLAARASVVEVHDAILNRHPEYFANQAQHAWYHAFTRELVANADRLLVHSRSVAGEVVRDLGGDPARIDVANLAVEPAVAAMPEPEVRRHLQRVGVAGDYFVLVGKDYPHKDHACAFRALARTRAAGSPVRIVCAGSRVWRQGGQTSDELLLELGLQDAVTWISDLDDVAMSALLQGSRGLLYPSREEGFGLPPIEAMAVGVLVIAAEAMSIPEVCGEGAWLFPPGDHAALARLMRAALGGGGAVREQIERGRKRCARYSWARCADETIECYRQAIAAAGQRRPRLGDEQLTALRVIAASPWDEAKDLAAWQERCVSTEYLLGEVERSRAEILRELNALQAKDGLPLTPAPGAGGGPRRPRFSLKRRLQKIRDGLRRRRE